MKRKMSRFLTVLAMVVLLLILIFAVYQVIMLLGERKQSREVAGQLTELAVTQEPKMQTLPTEDAEHEPCYTIPISVDFGLLKQQAPDIRGWIYCPDTPIHYPVVQGKDNRYYLRRLPTGQWNHAGSVFLDSRNPADLSGRYNLLHGHNLKDDTMFGTLPNYKEQSYYEAHKLLYFLTPDADYVIELFAGFTADSDDIIYTIPLTGKQRMELAERCIARSDFVSQVQPKEDDPLMILSTCAYDYEDARYAVIGVLRKNEPRSALHGGK